MKLSRWLAILTCFSFSACASNPPLEQDVIAERIKEKFQPSLSNRYAVLINGAVFKPREHGSFGPITFMPDVQAHQPIKDSFVETDMQQMSVLLSHKNYDIYRINFETDSFESLEDLILDIVEVADENTRVVIAYSGEGNNGGLRPCTLKINGGLLVPGNATIHPEYLFSLLSDYPGITAMIINACESGIFVNKAPLEFPGVIIAACQEGTRTTPYEPFGMTAVFSTFVDLYSKDIQQVIELSELDMPVVGGWWTNMLHKLLTSTDQEISYEPVIFKNYTKFPL